LPLIVGRVLAIAVTLAAKGTLPLIDVRAEASADIVARRTKKASWKVARSGRKSLGAPLV